MESSSAHRTRQPLRPPPVPRAAPKAAALEARALVPAVSRALTLLDRLAEQREPMSLARLAADLALPKSSVHGLCSTLMRYGYLRRQADGGFLIGPRVMGLAQAFVAGTSAAHEFAGLWRDGAAPAPDETIVLSVLDGREVVYVATRPGNRPLGLAFEVGMRMPAHLAATGKAMLAFHSADAVRSLFTPGPLRRMTGKGPRNMTELSRELSLARRRGYSLDDEGVCEGVICFAAPVFDAAGSAVAGIGVCFNKARRGADGGARHLQAVQAAAQRLSQRLGGVAPVQSNEARGASRER